MGFVWPQGASCGVSLTYDDGKPTQLEHALPALDLMGLKGSFFLTGDWVLEGQIPLWRTVGQAGHELAGHGMRHACSREIGQGWLEEADLLESYDLARMERELDDNLGFLRGLGRSAPTSFAYPCGESWVGKGRVSYEGLVRSRFKASRGGSRGLADPETVDLYQIPSLPGHLGGRQELKRSVEEACQRGAWLVCLFHGVGGDNSPVAIDDHLAFLNHLSRRKDVWVAPLGEVADEIRRQRGGD